MRVDSRLPGASEAPPGGYQRGNQEKPLHEIAGRITFLADRTTRNGNTVYTALGTLVEQETNTE
jgi:hypothetical protein